MAHCCALQEEAIRLAVERLRYQQSALLTTLAQDGGLVPSTPNFALAINDHTADASVVSSAPDVLRKATLAIEHAEKQAIGLLYKTVMPSATLLHDAPIEATALVSAAHAAGVSVLTWTVRYLRALSNPVEPADRS